MDNDLKRKLEATFSHAARALSEARGKYVNWFYQDMTMPFTSAVETILPTMTDGELADFIGELEAEIGREHPKYERVLHWKVGFIMREDVASPMFEAMRKFVLQKAKENASDRMGALDLIRPMGGVQ